MTDPKTIDPIDPRLPPVTPLDPEPFPEPEEGDAATKPGDDDANRPEVTPQEAEPEAALAHS